MAPNAFKIRKYRLLTRNIIKDIHSWEANSFSAGQKIPCLSWSEGSLQCLQGAAIGPYPKPGKSSPSYISFTICSSKWSFPYNSPPHNRIHFSLRPCRLHALPTWSTNWFNHLNNIWWTVWIMKWTVVEIFYDSHRLQKFQIVTTVIFWQSRSQLVCWPGSVSATQKSLKIVLGLLFNGWYVISIVWDVCLFALRLDFEFI
jgi:hypothetical protein